MSLPPRSRALNPFSRLHRRMPFLLGLLFILIGPSIKSQDDDFSDSDGDGLVSGEEIVYGTAPQNSDSDGDGLSDSQEVDGLLFYSVLLESPELVFTSPTQRDSDGDNLPDGYEYDAGLHPADPSDGNADEDGD